MITITQAILLGLVCGLAKSVICYTINGFNINTVIFNAVLVGIVMGDMKTAMIVGASVQLIYLGIVAAGGNQPTDPCLASYIAIPIVIASGLDTNAAVALAVPVAIANYFGSTMLANVMNNIPTWLTNGLSAMGACLPAVGFAIITNLIAKPKYVIFFFAGFFMVQYTGISTIPLLLAGVFVTFLYVTFTRTGNQSLDDEDDDDDDEEYEAAGEHLLSNFDILKVWTRWMV